VLENAPSESEARFVEAKVYTKTREAKVERGNVTARQVDGFRVISQLVAAS
jgi:hypothetical protein